MSTSKKTFENKTADNDWEGQTDSSAAAEEEEANLHESMHRCVIYIQRIAITILLVGPLLWAIMSPHSMFSKFVLGAVYPILGSLGLTLGILLWMKSR